MRPYIHHGDPHRYIDYYGHQAGSGLEGFRGNFVQYGGFNIASLFKGLYRMAMPLIRKGVSIAKPHLKSAARSIVGDVIHNVINTKNGHQDGAGLSVVTGQPFDMRAINHPPPRRRRTKHRKKTNKTSVKISRRSLINKKRKKKQVHSRPTKRRRLSIF